ncbi:nuclear transport factor 2 family protein [Dyadobacter sp. CY343]|uniref:nuclear transport factor 2 family protein n=1 Tax=Dyadobacter sp. CY343 TaxID=2907299 RepID=UPI001F2539E7|nr:nuclear transport factor 2 family protein [Dyadobacter sp. CY343]MCE7061320.1 nuclear transport factor 2 family protein [Dyadobacter sp. CY343]
MKKSLLLFACLLLINLSVSAQSSDEENIASQVERLRVALLDAKEEDLTKLTSPALSYGHSNGLMEDKKAFLLALTSGESNFTKIDLSEQTVSVSGDVAMVRHKLKGETHNKGKEPAPISLGVLLIWQKVKGDWLLLGRQAFRLP